MKSPTSSSQLSSESNAPQASSYDDFSNKLSGSTSDNDQVSPQQDATKQASVTSLIDDLSQVAQATTTAAQEQFNALKANIGTEISATAEEKKKQGAQAIQGFARVIDTAAAEMDKQSPVIGRYFRDAAREVSTLGNNLSNRNLTELVDSASNLARNRPALFFGGAVLAGVAIARFFKSSAGRAGSDQSNII